MRGERCYISSKITNKLEQLGSREENFFNHFNNSDDNDSIVDQLSNKKRSINKSKNVA